jgi:hypothetical protein
MWVSDLRALGPSRFVGFLFVGWFYCSYVSQPATHKLPYLKCISRRYGTENQQKKKIAESKVGRIHFIGKERVVVDQAQPTRKRGSPKQEPFLKPSRSPWSCAAFDVQNRNEQDRCMPGV